MIWRQWAHLWTRVTSWTRVEKLKWKIVGGNFLIQKLDQTRTLDPREVMMKKWKILRWKNLGGKFLLWNIYPWKIFTPEQYSPLKYIHINIHPWEMFTPEKCSPLYFNSVGLIHPVKLCYLNFFNQLLCAMCEMVVLFLLMEIKSPILTYWRKSFWKMIVLRWAGPYDKW